MSLVGVALFTVGLAGSISHVELVQHEICAEHGELVEHYGPPHADGRHGHEVHEPQKHCSLLLCTAYLASHAPTELLGPVTFVVHETTSHAVQLSIAHCSYEPLALAPKTSPPTA